VVYDLSEGRKPTSTADKFYFQALSPELRRTARAAREEMDRSGHVQPAYEKVVRGAGPTPKTVNRAANRLVRPAAPGSPLWSRLWAMIDIFLCFRADKVEVSTIASKVPDDYRQDVLTQIGDLISWLMDLNFALEQKHLEDPANERADAARFG
jgi:hypothetical protein